ncbi:UNVERIFIED_CONTAM: hypothetical protein Sradi_3991300 [Sesamum radiatum]|uniref:Uncharacterized protein n=1 Tax=Sesamum radiatum TaxID=300843 RepID=A0AAW2PGY4_SESRA
MANSYNGGDNGSYEENSYLLAVASPIVPPATNALVPNPTLEAASAPARALKQTTRPVAMTHFFCE